MLVSQKEQETASHQGGVVAQKTEPPYVMYILVNTDLKMGTGKIAGQVGHVVGLITEHIITSAKTKTNCPNHEEIEDYEYFVNWCNKSMYTKVILKATRAELDILKTEKKCIAVYDAGRTQIPANNLTVVGFFPRNGLREKFSKFKLL